MVDKVPFKQNVNIGSTLDDQLGPCASPFEAESLEVFVAKMAEMKCNEDAFGTINFQEKLIEDQSDVSKYLDINGALALTYGPVSGNAEVQFAMNNVASDLDISLMIKATHVGEYKAANEVLLNKLKLKDRIANGISKEMTKEEFTKQYGKYLIIGIENGGKMLYTQTIKARNKSDKLKAGGLLQVKLNQTGFSVEGSAKGEFKDEEYSNHVNIETKKTIQPSYNDKDDLIGTVIGQLEKLTDPNISKNDDFIKNHSSLKGEIEKNLQKYFAGKLEPVYFIVKELEHISCVADAFAGKAGNWDGIKIESFCEFSNKLFVKLNWMQNTIKRYEENISSLDLNNKDNKELSQLKQLYESALATKIAAMKTVNRNELYGNAKKYNELARLRDIGESKEDNDKKEVCKPFIQIRITELTSQFNKDINIPLEKISELQLPKPNEAEQKLKLFWVFGNELHAKLVLMQCKIKDYETKLLGSWNLNDENDKKLNDNISKWQKQITQKIFHLSSIGEKQVGEEADNYYKTVNEDKNKKKKKNNDNKGEIEKNWVEINIAQLEKEFEEEIEIPSQKRLSTDDDEKMMDDKWVDLDLLPCHVANAMIKKEVNCRSLDDLQKLSKIGLQNCILHLMNESLLLTPLASDGSSQLVGTVCRVLSVKSGLAIDVLSNSLWPQPSDLQLCRVLKESPTQHWKITAACDGYMYVQGASFGGSGLYWDIGGDSQEDGEKLIQFNPQGRQYHQQFRIDKMNNYKVDNKDVFMITNRNSGKAISINGKHAEGAKINQSNPNGNNNQLFTLEQVSVNWRENLGARIVREFPGFFQSDTRC